MTLRTRELVYLLAAALAVSLAYATVFIARSNVVDAASLTWAGFFLALYLLAHVAVRRFAPLADPYLLPITALLSGLGITMVYRLNASLASKQAIWLVVAVVGMLLLLYFVPDHRRLEHYKYVIGVAGVLALVVTVSPLGKTVNGSKLWIDFGLFQIQPGEFAKLAIVVFLAAYLREHRELLRMRMSIKHLGPLLLFSGASLALLVLMRDFGTSLLFFGTFLLMVYVATARVGYVTAGLALFGAGSALVYTAAPHVKARFDIWLDPWKDSQDAGYQIVQGLFALADGGLFGRGLGQALLVAPDGSYLIPDVHTDFIFAALADELGFVGAVGMLLVYALFTWRGFAIAGSCTDGFSKLLAFGLTATFAIQTVIIVGGVVRLLPLTGQTLPFVSYGGSSVVANFALMTMLLVISHRTRSLQRATA